MFGRNWQPRKGNKDSYDINTAPMEHNLIEKLRQIEAQSLSMVVEEHRECQDEGEDEGGW